MVAMTDDMKSMIANNLCYIATVDESGYPDIGPKISMQVKDDSHLFYYERTARQHLHNLRDNGKMVVAVATKDNKHGYRFHGPVELVDSGDFYEEALKFADEHGLKHVKWISDNVKNNEKISYVTNTIKDKLNQNSIESSVEQS